MGVPKDTIFAVGRRTIQAVLMGKVVKVEDIGRSPRKKVTVKLTDSTNRLIVDLPSRTAKKLTNMDVDVKVTWQKVTPSR